MIFLGEIMVHKQFKKSGTEIIELYKDMNKAGVTPEQVMLYLMAHMQQTKSTKIGMDVSNPMGGKFCITVEVNSGTTDEQLESKPDKIKNKIPPGVT
jgi:hypothetical protein